MGAFAYRLEHEDGTPTTRRRSKLRCRTGGRAELAPPASFHIRSVWEQRPRRSRRFGRWIP
jgi:hypothetical protein